MEEYGGVVCKDVQTSVLGRSYNFWDDDEREEFFAAGGRVDKCPSVVGNASKWAVEIILDAEAEEG